MKRIVGFMGALGLGLGATDSLAATPNPDRPSISRSGFLIADDTLEFEVGAQWSGGRTAPATVKYNIAGVVEPRIGLDLSGLDGGMPALTAVAKIRIYEGDTLGLAAYVDSAIPVAVDESWLGTLALLATWTENGWGLQGNAGISLQEPVVDLRALQFSVLGSRALGSAFSVYGEVGFEQARGAFGSFIANAGLGWSLTESLVLDAAFGWDFANETPYAGLGLTVNFGVVRGSRRD